MAKPKYQQLVLRDFRGGLRSGIPDRSYDLRETPRCQNVDFKPEGAITKRQGYQLKSSTTVDGSGNPVTHLDQFFTSTGTDYLAAFTAESGTEEVGSVYHWNSSSKAWEHYGADVMGSAWTPTYDTNIITDTFADNLIATNGTSDSPIHWNATLGTDGWEMLPASGTAAYVYTDTTTSDGTAMSACVPCVAIKGFKSYLFMGNTIEGGTAYPGRIRWSALEDPFSWPVENYIDLDPNDGDSIVGMEVLGDHLIVFKERKVYAIAWIGGIYLFDDEIRVDGRGCVAPQSITSTYTDLMFMAEDGIYTFTGHHIDESSYRIKDLVLDINPTSKALVQGAPKEDKTQLWFIAGMEDSATNNAIFVYDYQLNIWDINYLNVASVGYYYVTSDLVMADLTEAWDTYNITWDDKYALANTTLMIIGTYDGYVADMGLTESDGDGGDIDASYTTPWLDMKDPGRTKRIMRITFYVKDEGTDNYGLDWYLRTDWDDSETPVTSGVLPLSGGTAGEMIEQRIDMTQQARAFQLEFGTDSANEPWTVYEIHIDYTMKGTPSIDASNA